MIKKYVLLIVSFYLILNAMAQPPGAGWGEPIFSDEFNDSTLNTDKWRYNTSTTEFSKDNVVLSGGIMSIHNIYTANEVATGGWVMSNKAGFVGDNKYGYYEAKIRINAPATGQIWPTWWIWGGNWRDGGPAPSTTEFDLMEYSGWAAAYYDNHASSSHHYKAKAEINGSSSAKTTVASAKTRNAFEWHTWGLLWTPTEVSFWYDGETYFTSPEPEDAAKEDIEMNLIFSCSPHIGTNPIEANKPIPGNALPSFEIDWVRVWRGGDANATEIENVLSKDFVKFFPNPVQGGESLTLRSAELTFVQVFNSAGQLVYSSPQRAMEHHFSSQGMTPGVYCVTLNSPSQVSTQKLIIK